MTLPAVDYHRVGIRRPPPLPQGLDALAHGACRFWPYRRSRIQTLYNTTAEVEARERNVRDLSDRLLRERLSDAHTEIRRHGLERAQAHIPPALAALREAAFRTTGMMPYPVQIVGALAMNEGYLAEMATGEGKTLVAALVAVLSGWTHRPCHVVTVNDYLARRDAEWFRPFYRWCGLSCDCVTADLDAEARRSAYDAAITYTTSKELLADFLRDRLRLQRTADPQRRLLRKMLMPGASERETLILRGLHTAIVDEADSILIDEAVTPLIIARQRDNPLLQQACAAASTVADQMIGGRDYTTDARYREVALTDQGIETARTLARSLPAIWQGAARRRELIEQAITARIFFLKDHQYIVQDGKVAIVDEFTGRVMPQRSWSEGLHQAIEAKEGLEITSPNETVARLSFQRFFRLFPRLSGMTGTASEARHEFWRIYRLPVLRIPTHRPCRREILPEQVFATASGKWDAIVAEITRLHHAGRPVLIGTRNVEASELLAARMDQEGLSFNLLNAVRHAEEARIVAEAGHAGRITIATNMAGRGTDIKLSREVAAQGGLHVIATERHASARIDRQLFGRTARQGDPGTARGFSSLEDELVTRFLPGSVRRSLSPLLGERDEPPPRPVMIALANAQRASEKQAYRQRCAVLRTDTWLDESLSFAEDPGAL